MEVETYHQTGTRILGGLWVGLAVVGTLMAVSDGLEQEDVPWLGGFVLTAVLSWTALIRPQVRLTTDHLVLRNMLETITIPLVAVEVVRVGRVMAVRAGERRFVSPAVSRPLRDVARGRTGSGHRDTVHLADFLEERVRTRADEARTRTGVAGFGAEAPDVRRQLAWLEIGLAALSVLAIVVGRLA